MLKIFFEKMLQKNLTFSKMECKFECNYIVYPTFVIKIET